MKQKDSTKDIVVKKQSGRSRAKYPALERKYNLKTRQDYIELDYVNGVINSDGECVIRALNDEEKTFLNAYYEEVVGANFIHDKDLRRLYEEMKPLKRRNDLDVGELDDLSILQDEYNKRADEVLLYSNHSDQKKIYGENNARNRCLYNKTKAIGILSEVNDETYDEFHKNAYNDPDSGENLMINLVEPRIRAGRKKKKG